MARSVTCTPDRFAVCMDEMMREIADGVGSGLRPVVERAGKTAVRGCRDGARAKLGGTGAYASGFRKKVRGSGAAVSCEVGNAKLPGLVHLLEKGHATIGGGRVAGRPHVDPAAQKAFGAVADGIDELVGRVLG